MIRKDFFGRFSFNKSKDIFSSSNYGSSLNFTNFESFFVDRKQRLSKRELFCDFFLCVQHRDYKISMISFFTFCLDFLLSF